jgi:hypothetical protein
MTRFESVKPVWGHPAIRIDLSPFPLMVAHSAAHPFKNYSAIVAI